MLREISHLFHERVAGLGFGFFHAEADGISEIKSCHGRMSLYLKWYEYRNSFFWQPLFCFCKW